MAKQANCFVIVAATFLMLMSAKTVKGEHTQQTVEAKEILEKLARGDPVVYTNVLVKGSLSLKEAHLDSETGYGRSFKVINNSVAITFSSIESRVDLSNAIFDGAVNFEGTEFKGWVHFDNSIFRGRNAPRVRSLITQKDGANGYIGIALVDSLEICIKFGVKGGAFVIQVFPGSAADKAGVKPGDLVQKFGERDITRAIDLVYLVRQSTPGDTLTLTVLRDSMRLKLPVIIETHTPVPDYIGKDTAYVSFFSAKFRSPASFSDCHFNKVVTFSGASFDQIAVFYGTIFEEAAFFMCIFDKPVGFNGARFRRKALFSPAEFMKGASFFNADFNGEANFASSRVRDGMEFGGAAFHDTVDLSWIDCDRMSIDWQQIKGRLRYDRESFAFIRKNFDNIGKPEDADQSFYEYRNRKRKSMKWHSPARFFELVFLDWSCGYGTMPTRAIVFSLALVILFALCFWKPGAIRPKEESGSVPGCVKRLGNSLYFSANTFTTVGYGDWVPTEEYLVKLGRFRIFKFRHIAMLEGFLGWVMLSLFLITLARTWIR